MKKLNGFEKKLIYGLVILTAVIIALASVSSSVLPSTHVITENQITTHNTIIKIPDYINTTITKYKTKVINQTTYSKLSPLVIMSGSAMFKNLTFDNSSLNFSIYSEIWNANLVYSSVSKLSKIEIFDLPTLNETSYSNIYRFTNTGNIRMDVFFGKNYFCNSNAKDFSNFILNKSQSIYLNQQERYIMLVPIPTNANYNATTINIDFYNNVQKKCSTNATIENLNQVYVINP